MTQAEIKKLFPDAADEQIDTLLQINAADVEKMKKKQGDFEAELKKTKDDLEAAKSTIADLEKSKGDAEALQKALDEYRAADERRTKEAEAAAAKAASEARYATATGKREFAHDYIKAGVLSDFEKALADEAYKGKGDTEIFDALTKDRDGIFKPQSIGVNMGGFGNASGDNAPPAIQSSKELNKHRIIQ